MSQHQSEGVFPMVTDLLAQTVVRWCQENLEFGHMMHVKGIINIHRDKELIVATLDEVIRKDNDTEVTGATDDMSTPSPGFLSHLAVSGNQGVISAEQLQEAFKDALQHVVKTEPTETMEERFQDEDEDADIGDSSSGLEDAHTPGISMDSRSAEDQRSSGGQRSPKGQGSQKGNLKRMCEDERTGHSDPRGVKNTEKHSCSTCGQIFTKIIGLERHRRSLHGESKSSGKKADKTGNVPLSMTNYQITNFNKEDEIRNYVCGTCYQGFTSLSEWKVHTEQHEMLQSTDNTSQHRQGNEQHSQSETSIFVCEPCGQNFKSHKNYVEHQRGKHGNRMYVCQCGREFKWRSGMRSHRDYCPFLKMLSSGETT